MSPTTTTRATLSDLAKVTGKAELVGGEIRHLMPSGRLPNRVAARIFRSLDDFAQSTGQGEAYTDNIGFAVPELASGRESFSPDASWFRGPFTSDALGFLEGPPTFAVEVRSEGNYGPAAEAELQAKRADYFEAGTEVVWDVDAQAQRIRAFSSGAPDLPLVFLMGDLAHAEPALPGWRMSVDQVFDGR